MIYIHIPFCLTRCAYCAFYSTTEGALKQAYVDALCREMASKSRSLEAPNTQNSNTIYLGGGTPSQLSFSQLKQIRDSIYRHFEISDAVEFTVECNPDDITPALARHLGGLGVNRVSMGAQTFQPRLLKLSNRRHKAEQVAEAVEMLRQDGGIGNISLDLMYGFPSETVEEALKDAETITALLPNHISTYCLSIEENTPLYNIIRCGKMTECDEETERTMYYAIKDLLESRDYEHYELSNFALPGFHSRHNSGYWSGEPYSGLGAAAHSFDGAARRSWNIADINKYIRAINNGEPHSEGEDLTTAERFNDMVMLALRTRQGIDLAALEQRFGSATRRTLTKNAARFVNDGLLISDKETLRLTRQGLFVSDMITSELMQTD